MRLALVATTSNPFASCLRHSKLREKTEIERSRYTFCSLCAKHDNSLLLLPYFRQPAVLSAPPSKRLAALFATPHAAKALDEHCPMRASMGNLLRTGTVIRRPVDRVISKYFFLRTCACARVCRTRAWSEPSQNPHLMSHLARACFCLSSEYPLEAMIYPHPWSICILATIESSPLMMSCHRVLALPSRPALV